VGLKVCPVILFIPSALASGTPSNRAAMTMVSVMARFVVAVPRAVGNNGSAMLAAPS